MPRFLVLARDDNSAFSRLSPAEMEAVIHKYIAWSESLRRNGSLVASDKLKDGEGRVLGKSGGREVVNDGPFSEVKEIVGGYWILQADGYDAVKKLCAASPHLDFGTLEIRQIEELG
jgi:hypothetical protein